MAIVYGTSFEGVAERIGESRWFVGQASLAEEMAAEDKLRRIAITLIEIAPTEDAVAWWQSFQQ